MRLPKLDNRLHAIYEMLGGTDSVCDVGADHGKLALKLAKTGKNVIAADISRQSLKKTERLAKLHEADIDCRLGDGLEKIRPGEVKAAVMAGMGQNTIIGIIRAGREVVDACDFIIAQPMNGEYDLRSFLSDEGFAVVEERVAQEGKRLYCIIKAVPSGGKVLSEKEKYFGPCLLEKEADLNTAKYFERNIEILKDIVTGMEHAGETKSERYLKIKKVLDTMKAIK